MPLNSRGKRVETHNQTKQKAQAQALRKPKTSTGGTIGGAVGGAG
jgi:hypothetical protein